MSRRSSSLLVLALTLGLFLVSSLAQAAGRVEWKTKEFKEREGGSWRLDLALYLPSPPDVAHVPMKFEFEPTAYYERSMVEGDKLIERTVPLEHRQALIESVDVGFLDAGSGKIEKRTRFTFKVTRAHGYEAGEYKVTIRDGRNGKVVGTATTLKFQGENEIIDRRPMVFTGKEKKKKEAPKEEAAKEESTSEEGASAGGEEKAAAEPSAEEKAADEGSESSDGEEASSDDGSDGPPPEKKKPGGCGCRFDSSADERPLVLSALGVLGLALLRRRRAAR